MAKVRLASRPDLSLVDAGGKMCCAIFFQGCSIHCKNCHNPELWDFSGGYETTTEEIVRYIEERKDWFQAVAIMGGEPLDQQRACLELLVALKKLNIEIWLYTGYRAGEFLTIFMDFCDVVVAGPYEEDLRTGSFPASSNQIVIDRRRPM